MLVTNEVQTDAIRIASYRCDAGPDAQPFTEMHEGYSVSYVRKGSFGYRTRGNAYELVAGSVLVGCPGDEYVCTTTTSAATSVWPFTSRRASST